MSSIPYSRYLIGHIPWYSVLIVLGVILAIVLTCREERQAGLPKDTVIDLALWIIPFGIIGARIYYVVFAWDQFKEDPFSIFRIWEGGLAIYGGIIAGFIVLVAFCRKRNIKLLKLCDMIVPGLALAQSIGRWGNWFNIEAYGLAVTNANLCFFPVALQVPADGYIWHLATFFYESLWDFLVFLFLIIARRRFLHRQGDVFFFYLLLYAAGRLVIEELRLDSLYAVSSVRISQLLSIILCIAVLIRYILLSFGKSGYRLSLFMKIFLPIPFIVSCFSLFYALSGSFPFPFSHTEIIAFLAAYAVLIILSLFLVYRSLSVEVSHADNKA